MKLVLKLPKNKPPFIGVQFSNEYEASRTHAEAVYSLNGAACTLTLEPCSNHTVNLYLRNKDKLVSLVYKNLDCSPGKLKQWLHYVSASGQFNFGHVTLEHDTHKISKVGSGMKNFVIKLESVKMISEE